MNGRAEKIDLTPSPFEREHKYGQNYDRYWVSNNKAVQLEDCVDCLKFIYSQFDFFFFLDSSNAHDHLRPNSPLISCTLMLSCRLFSPMDLRILFS